MNFCQKIGDGHIRASYFLVNLMTGPLNVKWRAISRDAAVCVWARLG